jgi:hypothetical protein
VIYISNSPPEIFCCCLCGKKNYSELPGGRHARIAAFYFGLGLYSHPK